MLVHRWRGVLPPAIYAVATALWLSPILGHPASTIPGAAPGDNLTFIWNTWWVRQALAAHAPILSSPVIFAPFGVSLTLHTLTLLPSGIAAVLPFSVVTATNAVIALHLFLNFGIAHTLAFRSTRSHAASLVAGLVFGWSPYIAAHLAGHFNLIAAWVLPLTALALGHLIELGTRPRAILLGVALGLTIYVDYYYAVYAIALIATVLLGRCVTPVALRPRRPWQSVAVSAVAILLALVLGLILFIAMLGGTSIQVGGLGISMRSVDNPVAAAGVLMLLAAGLYWLPRARIHFNRPAVNLTVSSLPIAAVSAVLIASPVLISAFRLWSAGDYVSQKYFWKSAPQGIDLATLILGNPGGLLWRDWVVRAYLHSGIDGVEQVAWLGLATLTLCYLAIAHRRENPLISRWCVAGGVFALWALGPHLVAFGQRLNVLLPSILVRYVPIVANARIPSRAIVVVYLAVAMLSAFGFASLRARRRGVLAWALMVGVVLDFLPRPVQVLELDHPAIYDIVRADQTPGTVCELPMGLRDGFGETGRFDSRTLWYQTIHGRPITGGFVARLSPRLVRAYSDAPVLGSLLRLSSGKPLAEELMPAPGEAWAALRAQNIRFVVVNRDGAAPDLLQYVRRVLPLRLLATDGGRDLYVVQDP